MTVPHPHRHTAAAGHPVVEHTESAVMAVENPVGMPGEKAVQLMQVTGNVIVLPNGQFCDLPAQGPDFLIVKAGFVVVVQKIKLHLRAVNGTVDIHDESLHAAGIHGRHHL